MTALDPGEDAAARAVDVGGCRDMHQTFDWIFFAIVGIPWVLGIVVLFVER